MEAINPWVIFKKKLQTLKYNTKLWNVSSRDWLGSKRKDLQEILESINDRLMGNDGSAVLREQRVSIQKKINELDHISNIDRAQKAKIH